MTPKNPARKPLTTKKRVAVGVAAVVIAAAGGAALGVLTAQDADAHPGHSNCEPAEAQQDHPCDPLTFILGEPPAPASDATTWQDLMVPPGGWSRVGVGTSVAQWGTR